MCLISRLFSYVIDYAVQSIRVCAKFVMLYSLLQSANFVMLYSLLQSVPILLCCTVYYSLCQFCYAVQSSAVCANFEHSSYFVHLTRGAGV
jgi:hypothetical protein